MLCDLTPRKVAFLLEELGLTYQSVYLDFSKNEQKSPEHTNLNPNGRIPTLIDHKNGDFAVWESNAILLYLADKYDTEKRLTVTDEKERSSLIQWLFFQASGQGSVFVTANSQCYSTHNTCDVARTSARPYGSSYTTLRRSRVPSNGTARRHSVFSQSSIRSSRSRNGSLAASQPSLIYRSSLGTTQR